eukprot:382382-Pyramimonas_sp.AAC.1
MPAPCCRGTPMFPKSLSFSHDELIEAIGEFEAVPDMPYTTCRQLPGITSSCFFQMCEVVRNSSGHKLP